MKKYAGVFLTILLLTAIAIALTVGATSLPVTQLWRAINDPSALGTILWQIRIPRIALAILVGASLATAGAISQAVFANPVAEPSIIGIGSGAALGLLAAVALNLAPIGTFASVAFALAGALAVSLAMVRWVPRSPLAFLLTGIAIAALANALIGLITSFAGRSDLRSISFWTLGSLSLSTWNAVLITAPLTVIGLASAVVIAPKLDYLSLGNARHFGISVSRVQLVALISLSILVAASVALTGVITFVGLVVPHVLRLLVGAGHRQLIALTAIGGASLVLIADTISRWVLQPLELPIGLLTALVGAPILILSLRTLREDR